MGEEEEQVYTVDYIDELGATEAPMVGEAAWISRAGRAKVTYVNLDTYEGGYNEGKQRHGQGTYTWTSLKPPEPEEDEEDPNAAPGPQLPTPTYTGQYQYGKKHGLGTMVYPNGDRYRGQFAYNKRHGRGTYEYFATGDKYSGEWKEDRRHGAGVFVYKATESQLVGTFEKGQMVKGKWLLEDGTVYVGNFKASKPQGKGSFTLPNGNAITGAYKALSEQELEEDEIEVEEGEDPPTKWVASGAGEIALTSHAELSRPPMPALEYAPSWDSPVGNKNLEILMVDEESGMAIIQHTIRPPPPGEEEPEEEELEEGAEPKDTSANLRGMRLTLTTAADDGGVSIVFGDVSLAKGGRLRLLSGASAQVPPGRWKPKVEATGEDEEAPEPEEDEEGGAATKEYFVSNDNMFAGGLVSIKLDFMDKLGTPQLVWEVTRVEDEENEGVFKLEHEGTFKPVPPPEPAPGEGEEGEEEEEDE